MERAILFAVLFLLAALFALARGGAPERWAATSYLLAYALSVAATVNQSGAFESTQWSLFAIDVALVIALTVLALHANRYWTIWATSLQLVGITAHLSKMLVPEILAPAYAITLIVWSYAAIPILVMGTLRHRQRLNLYGTDADWSPG